MATKQITISNTAGGDARAFAWTRGQGLSDAAYDHARKIDQGTYGGVIIDDETARREYEQQVEDNDYASDY